MFITYKEPNFKTAKQDLDNLLHLSNKKIKNLLKIKNKTYKNFVTPYQLIFEKIHIFFTPYSIINSTKNSKQSAEIFPLLLRSLSDFDTKIKQNIKIYNAFKDILKHEKLNSAQKRVLELEIMDFELEGNNLDQKSKNKIKKINNKLSKLSNAFSQNVLDATNEFELILDDDSKISKMPQSDKNIAKVIINGKPKYKFSLQAPSFIAFMNYCEDRQLRQKMYKAYVTRALKNEDLIQKILDLRDKKAKILGFKDFSHLSLKRKMAKSPKEVEDFLNNLLELSVKKAQSEFQELKSFAKQKHFKDSLQSYDLSYYSKWLEKEKYSIDEEKYKAYFEKESVLKGFFLVLKKLFDIEFVEIKEKAWDKKVQTFIIMQNKKEIAKIYMDLEARKGKQSGAWMDSWVSYAKKEDNSIVLPVAYIVCNFAPSNKKNPSLLKHSDVVTLFHEMGHALHHLLSRVQEPFISGISGVEWDGVEFPSQFLEEFAYEEDVLKLFAKHYKTSKTLPKDMIKNLIKAKNFLAAMSMLRQLEFALFDIKIHKKPYSKKDVQKILDNIRKKTSIIKPPKYNKFQCSFTHIFAGGYACGYYSYKWAEVLSSDAFYRFKKEGIFNKKLAKSFLKNVLQSGGSRSMRENFKAFMKREPDIKALLKLSGIW